MRRTSEKEKKLRIREEIEQKLLEFLKKKEVTHLPEDPKLKRVTGYELCNKYSHSCIARAGAQSIERNEWDHKHQHIKGYAKEKIKIRVSSKAAKKRKKKWGKLLATEKQLKFLRTMKYEIASDLTMAKAFNMISQYLRLEKESDRRIFEAMERDRS